MWGKTDFYGIVAQAQDMVPGFKEGYRKFEQEVVLKRLSKGLLTNYGRNTAELSLHFGRCPESVSVEEINSYLYHKVVDEKVCESYMKHRFLLAFTYSTGMRLSELRFVKISDIDTDRMRVRVRQGKGKKDRYVVLSEYIKTKLPAYLDSYKPEIYLFEGSTPGHEMCERRSAKSPLDTLYRFYFV